MRAGVTALVALLIAPASALAEEKTVLSIEGRAGWTVMGGERPTGGLTLGAGARYIQPIGGGPWGWYAGAAADAVGVGDSWHWLGLLAGPEAGAWRGAGAWRFSAGLSLPMGQIPTCNDWGLCMRFWGVYPSAALRAAFRAESFQVGLEAGGMYVNTLAWSGASGQLRLVGSYR